MPNKPFTVKDQATIESLQAELAATRLELLRTIHRAEMAEKYHKMLTESLERKDSIIRTLTGKFDKGVNFNRRGAKQ